MTGRWTHSGLLSAALLAFIVAGWKASLVIGTLQGWEAWNQPKIAADLIQALIYGLIAFAAGIGVNVSTILKGFGISVGAPPTPHSAPQEPV